MLKGTEKEISSDRPGEDRNLQNIQP